MNNHENPTYSENKIEQYLWDKLNNLSEKSEKFTQANYDCYNFSEQLSDDWESLNEAWKKICENLNNFFALKNPNFSGKYENLKNPTPLTLS